MCLRIVVRLMRRGGVCLAEPGWFAPWTLGIGCGQVMLFGAGAFGLRMSIVQSLPAR